MMTWPDRLVIPYTSRISRKQRILLRSLWLYTLLICINITWYILGIICKSASVVIVINRSKLYWLIYSIITPFLCFTSDYLIVFFCDQQLLFIQHLDKIIADTVSPNFCWFVITNPIAEIFICSWTGITSWNLPWHLSVGFCNLLHRSKWDQQSVFTLKAPIMENMIANDCRQQELYSDQIRNISH